MTTQFDGRKVATIAAAWGGATLLALQAQRLPGLDRHSVCGLWGCGPPLSALIAMHAFWLALLSLPLTLCCRRLSPRRLMAISVIVLGLAGIAGVVAWEAEFWLARVGEFQREFFRQRCFFAVATMTDLPLMQLVFAGLLGCACACWRRPRSQPAKRPHRCTQGRIAGNVDASAVEDDRSA